MKPVIAKAFIAQFNVDGPKLNLDDVCSAIHMSKKTIYRFFRSKTNIYEYILKDATAEVLASQKEIYEDASLTIEEKIRKILTIPTKWENEIDISKIFTLKNAEPEVYTKIEEAYSNQWEYVLKLLNEANSANLFKENVHPAFLCGLLESGMLMMYSNGMLKKCNMTYTEGIQALATTVLDGAFAR